MLSQETYNTIQLKQANADKITEVLDGVQEKFLAYKQKSNETTDRLKAKIRHKNQLLQAQDSEIAQAQLFV